MNGFPSTWPIFSLAAFPLLEEDFLSFFALDDQDGAASIGLVFTR